MTQRDRGLRASVKRRIDARVRTSRLRHEDGRNNAMPDRELTQGVRIRGGRDCSQKSLRESARCRGEIDSNEPDSVTLDVDLLVDMLPDTGMEHQPLVLGLDVRAVV